MRNKPEALWRSLVLLIAVCAGMSCLAAWAAPDRGDSIDFNALTAEDVRPGELMIRFVPGVREREKTRIHRVTNGTLKHSFRALPWHHVQVPAGVSLQEAANAYLSDPRVDRVEPNYLYELDETRPDDPDYDRLWGMERIRAPEAWDITTGTEDIVVAVIDTGIRYTHEDLVDNIWSNPLEIAENGIDDDGNGYIDDVRGWDFYDDDNDPMDGHGHGTHCSGTIGGVGNNGLGVAGVNWNVKLVACQIFNAGGGATSGSEIARAIEYSALLSDYVRVSNNSWGGGGYSVLIRDAIALSGSKNQLFIAAAGNSATDNDAIPHYPSSYDLDNIIAVASIREGGALSGFSCYGATSVDIAAPGSDVYSTVATSDSSYESYSGTSMATPHVCGAAAFIWGRNLSASYQDIRDTIYVTAAPNPALTGRMTTEGELDLFTALTGGPAVLPSDAYVAFGEPGVPDYTPPSKTYTIRNNGETPTSWTIANSEPWLVVAPAAVTVPPSGETSIVASVDGTVATGLVEGIYTDVMVFENITDGEGSTTRDALLRLGDNYAMRSADYEWIDPISQAHGKIPFSGGSSAGILIPFDFSFYGSNYPAIYVSANGYIGIENENMAEADNADLPSTNAPNGIIAPYWDDLVSAQGSGVYIGTYGAPPDRYRVITWYHMAHQEDPETLVTFQVLIRETPSAFEDNAIIFQYYDVAPGTAHGAGRSASIGLEGLEGIFFRKYSFDGETALANEQALLFTMEPDADAVAPQGVVSAPTIAAEGALADSVTMTIRFDEIVTGLEVADLDFVSNIPGAGLGELRGGGECYEVTVSNLTQHGFVSVGVQAAAVEDLEGNPNDAFGPAFYVVPLEKVVFEDDMEDGSARWTTSDGVYPEYTEVGWEHGEPTWFWGPLVVPSGNNCWGTVLDGDYPNLMNGWVASDWIGVGDNPVLSFDVWYDTETFFNFITGEEYGIDFGYVEVDNGSGWINVTPDDAFTGLSAGWESHRIELNPVLFGNRPVRVRFRLVSNHETAWAGMYVDDVRVANLSDPGVWVYAYTPTNAAPESSEAVVFVAYNTDTQTYHDVTATVESLSPGLGLSGTVNYGDVAAGTVVTGTTVMATFGEVGLFNDPLAKFSHAATATEGVLSEEYLPIEVAGVSAAAGTNELTATSVAGVQDWMGQALRGDGGPGSSLFQVIYAGTNGTPDLPGSGGAVTGDDLLLFALDSLTPYGYFGVSAPADMGRFEQTFKHGLASNSVVYVRAWDGPSYAASVAYGDSTPVTIQSLGAEVQDFGSWVVGTPIDLERDLNGDTIPDGFDVLQGRDASQPVVPLEPEWSAVAIAGGTRGDGEEEMEFPGRVVATSNFVFVADTRNDRIQVWAPDLSDVISTFVGTGDYALNWPEGIALDEANNRLVVADTKNHRVVLLDVNPATGDLTGSGFFGTQGSGLAEFQSPYGIAVDSFGNIYVADTYNHRVRAFTSGGVPQGLTVGTEGSQFFLPKGVCVDGGGMIYVADGNHHVQVFDGSGTFVTNFGAGGMAVGEFVSPSGVQLGVGGRLVVADQGADRIQLFASNYVALAAYKPPAGERGSLPGQLWLPQGAWPMPDGNAIYVADTWNHRVQLLNMILDADGDGMNDAWEDANGECLDSSVADGDGDADGDGLSNVGEYRAGTDPCEADTDGDYVGDLWEMQNGYDPMEVDFDGVILTDLSIPSGHAVQWNVGTGAVYRVEGATDLLIPDWVPLTAITSTIEGLLTWTNSPAPTNDVYFYRVFRE